MSNEIIGTLITSGVALIASLISTIVSLRTFKIQRKLSNSPLQIEYLNRKFVLLDQLKNEITSLEHETSEEKVTLDNMVDIYVQYADTTLKILLKSIEKLKGYNDTTQLQEIEKICRKINNYIAFERAKNISSRLDLKEDFIDDKNPIDLIFETKDKFLKLLNTEMTICMNKIERIIEINAT